jgi:hypothetical protein
MAKQNIILYKDVRFWLIVFSLTALAVSGLA